MDQIGGVAAHGVIEEFTRAWTEMQANPLAVHLWQPIIAKYTPTLIGECQKAIQWSSTMVTEWLKSGMFANDQDADSKASQIINELADHALTLAHNRHISLSRALDLGINATPMESNQRLQDAILSLHHACIQTLASTPAIKIIQNQSGMAYMQSITTMVIPNGAISGTGELGRFPA